MCKLKNVNVGIKDLNFTARRGKMIARLTDGREITVPLSFFPDIKNLSVKERNKWMVLDDQYFTFEHLTRVYSVLDLVNVGLNQTSTSSPLCKNINIFLHFFVIVSIFFITLWLHRRANYARFDAKTLNINRLNLN